MHLGGYATFTAWLPKVPSLPAKHVALDTGHWCDEIVKGNKLYESMNDKQAHIQCFYSSML
jgi:hypothetical protein